MMYNREHLRCRMFTSVVWESKRGVQIAQDLALDLETRSRTHPYPQVTRARWTSCRKVAGAARWDVGNKTQPSSLGRDAGILGRGHTACIWSPLGQGWCTLAEPGPLLEPWHSHLAQPTTALLWEWEGQPGTASWRLAVATEKVVVWYGFSFSLKEGTQRKSGRWKSESEENHRNEKRERGGVRKKRIEFADIESLRGPWVWGGEAPGEDSPDLCLTQTLFGTCEESTKFGFSLYMLAINTLGEWPWFKAKICLKWQKFTKEETENIFQDKLRNQIVFFLIYFHLLGIFWFCWHLKITSRQTSLRPEAFPGGCGARTEAVWETLCTLFNQYLISHQKQIFLLSSVHWILLFSKRKRFLSERYCFSKSESNICSLKKKKKYRPES